MTATTLDRYLRPTGASPKVEVGRGRPLTMLRRVLQLVDSSTDWFCDRHNLRARPKRLRFQIFCSPGKLIHHARSVMAKVQRRMEALADWAEAWNLLLAPA